MRANKIRAIGPTDLKSTFSERNFKQLELCDFSLKDVATPQNALIDTCYRNPPQQNSGVTEENRLQISF